nr:MAG TPA: hypothetical protein [Caudoviricetes sp.]
MPIAIFVFCYGYKNLYKFYLYYFSFLNYP